MSYLLQTVIPAAVAVLAAFRGALTRTSRLRGSIRANLQLLEDLPADHPSRATLNVHLEELIDTLVRREARQFEPIIPAGVSVGANLAIVVIVLFGVVLLALEATGGYVSEPLSDGDRWAAMAFYGTIGVCCGGFAVRALRRAHATR